MQSLKVLDSIFEQPAPNNLVSLVLNSLIGISEEQIQVLFDSLVKCEVLVKLVLKDIPLGNDSIGAKLAKCVQNLYKLENLQLINCNLQPRSLQLVAKELEYNN